MIHLITWIHNFSDTANTGYLQVLKIQQTGIGQIIQLLHISFNNFRSVTRAKKPTQNHFLTIIYWKFKYLAHWCKSSYFTRTIHFCKRVKIVNEFITNKAKNLLCGNHVAVVETWSYLTSIGRFWQPFSVKYTKFIEYSYFGDNHTLIRQWFNTLLQFP